MNTRIIVLQFFCGFSQEMNTICFCSADVYISDDNTVGKNDLIFSWQFFPPDTIAALGTLYEQYEFYGAPLDTVVKAMDEKVISAWELT